MAFCVGGNSFQSVREWCTVPCFRDKHVSITARFICDALYNHDLDGYFYAHLKATIDAPIEETKSDDEECRKAQRAGIDALNHLYGEWMAAIWCTTLRYP